MVKKEVQRIIIGKKESHSFQYHTPTFDGLKLFQLTSMRIVDLKMILVSSYDLPVMSSNIWWQSNIIKK